MKIQPLKMIYDLWMKLGHVLGWINTRIILGIIFFTLITPMGVMMRIFKKEILQLKINKLAPSYRKKVLAQSIQHMEKPYSCSI
ncbi:MAG: SxtJ family membrane protein [Candidatus Berkiellales bacterium]